MKTVVMGIQARSTSTRLPNKAHMRIGGKPILKWVLDACQKAERYLRNDPKNRGISFNVALLVPEGDPITALYRSSQVPVIEGSENDVLSRYVMAQKQFNADYVVRVTADCVFIPAHHITKHVKSALIKHRDYTTNIHFRTHKEGWDCEVLSKRLLEWLDKNATEAYDREHVTTLIAKNKPFPFLFEDGKYSISHIVNLYDESHVKTSIDTQEEYDWAYQMYERYCDMRSEACKNGTCQE